MFEVKVKAGRKQINVLYSYKDIMHIYLHIAPECNSGYKSRIAYNYVVLHYLKMYRA